MNSRDHLERLRKLLDDIENDLHAYDSTSALEALAEASNELDAALDVFPDRLPE